MSSLQAGCPRCAVPGGLDPAGRWACPEHGDLAPLWRPPEATYDGFVDLIPRAGGFPVYLPWPMSPGWRVTDFGVVGTQPPARASVTCCSGTSRLDGPVDVLVVTEEPGTGLGARVAGTAYDDPAGDPGHELGEGPPTARVRIGTQVVPLWPVSTAAVTGEWDRSVLAGEALGRWLWLVVRPASAILLLRDDWILRDVSGLGPPLVEMPFAGPPPPW